MFGFFKNNRVKDWEIKLLRNLFSQLPFDASHFIHQIDDGLLKNRLLDNEVWKNYVGFSYQPGISKKYENRKASAYLLKGIKVYDKLSGIFIDFWVFAAGDLLCGYSTPTHAHFDLDPDRIEVGTLLKQTFGDDEFKSIARIFTKEEKKLINPSEVYEVVLDGKSFYHLMDIGDGDFIAVDIDKNVYQITHDPYEITLLAEGLVDVLSRQW